MKKKYNNISAVILAAGTGTRMKSSLPKVMHRLFEKPMVEYVIDAVEAIGIRSIIVVVGFGRERIEPYLASRKVCCAYQPQRLGTADALHRALAYVPRASSELLVLCGDAPLISKSTLQQLCAVHRKKNAGGTILTACVQDPTGYGRIVRDEQGAVARIVEELDASPAQRQIQEINSGAYIFQRKLCTQALQNISPNNKKKEYYLTDVVAYAVERGQDIQAYCTANPHEIKGINTRKDLSEAITYLRTQILDQWMAQGVTIVDPMSTFIDPTARIGQDTQILPFSIIGAQTEIGKECVIGPYAHVRAKTRLADGVHVGAFVEVNRSTMGKSSKAKHQAYLGDAVIGKEVNIGAGTIIANYDGTCKHTTIIEDKSFIGSGTILVAPVKIGCRAITGAGAVVPKHHNVPKGKVVVGVPAQELKKKMQ